MTRVPLATELPYRSTTVAVNRLVLPTTSEVGSACNVAVKGSPATTLTIAVPEIGSCVAVINWWLIGVVGAVKTPLSIKPILDPQVGVIDTELPY